MGKTNIEDDDRYEFKGVKIAHELMVDILGALIPGALFLFCTIVCIVFPIICYLSPNTHFGFLLKDANWFWIVAFLSFLILSYVIGMLFYRADIKEPDRNDIRREQLKKLKILSEDFSDRSIAQLLKQEIEPLENTLKKYQHGHYCTLDSKSSRQSYVSFDDETNVYGKKFLNNCKTCIDYISCKYLGDLKTESNSGFNDAEFQKAILGVLFPECELNTNSESKSYTNSEGMSKNDWTSNPFSILFPSIINPAKEAVKVINKSSVIIRVIKQYKDNHKKIDTKDIDSIWKKYHQKNEESYTPISYDKDDIDLYRLAICYMVLHMQNESGCATEDRCDFPYMSYYKYLLKRGLTDFLKYVNWHNPSARTKNQLNKFKIILQLNVPNAYSILAKNESHIRMASSSWHVAKVIKKISRYSLWASVLFLIIELPISHEDFLMQKEYNSFILYYYKHYFVSAFIAILFPLLTRYLSRYIIKNVPKFIHYQRLREIYYTLNVYLQWEEVKTLDEERFKQNLAIRRAEAGMPPLPSDNMPPNMNFF